MKANEPTILANDTNMLTCFLSNLLMLWLHYIH